MWEDPQNKDGGKFVLTLPKSYRSEGRTDECWLYTVLAVIGETLDSSGEEVCGCVVSIRKSQDRIALWLRSSDKKKCTEVSFDCVVCLVVILSCTYEAFALICSRWWHLAL